MINLVKHLRECLYLFSTREGGCHLVDTCSQVHNTAIPKCHVIGPQDLTFKQIKDYNINTLEFITHSGLRINHI